MIIVNFVIKMVIIFLQALLNIIYNGCAIMPRFVLAIINIIIVIANITLFLLSLTSKKDGTLLERAMTLLDVALPGDLRSEVFPFKFYSLAISEQ